MTRSITSTSLALLAAGCMAIGFIGCSEEKTTGDKIRETGDAIGDAVDDVADSVGDAADDIKDKADDGK